MAEISKITLPTGNTYDLKDATARSMIAGGISFNIVWTKTQFESTTAPTSTVLANIPEDVVVYYNNGSSSATGTKEATASTKGTFYLVYSKTQSGVLDKFDEYATIEDGSTYFWEKIGDTQMDLSSLGALAYKDSATVNTSGHTVTALTSSATFTNASSAVSFAAHTTDTALGTSATFTTSVTPTTTNIKATASGGGAAWNSKDQKTVLTGVKVTSQPSVSLSASTGTAASGQVSYLESGSVSQTTNAAVGASGTDTFVKSYPGTTSKLVTSDASKCSFSIGSGADSETLIIGCADRTVATGSLNASASGASVLTGLGTATTASAVTGVEVTTQPAFTFSGTERVLSASASGAAVGADGTANVIGASSTFTNTQPTVALATGATAGTGVISVATGITSASTSVNSADTVTAITALGAGTAAAQTITVAGTNGTASVLKADNNITAS